MRFRITQNDDDQCFDVRVQRGVNGQVMAYQVTTRDLLAWLQGEITSSYLGELVLDTTAVDTPEPRYLIEAAV